MSIETLDAKVNAIVAIETTNGEFNTPVAANKNFPIGKVDFNVDSRMSEGVSDANGKFSPARMFPNGLLGTFTIPSSMMKVDDIATDTGEIEIAPLFEMSGYQITDNAGSLELVYNGDGNCKTGSMRVLNQGCGTSTEGKGTDFRGMHGSISVTAETAGAEFKVSLEGQAAIEGEPDSTKAVIASDYINDASTRAVELFRGSVEINAGASAVEKLSFAMNVELMERKSADAGKNGIDFIYEANVKPTVSMTAPLGVNTASWWGNVIDGNVISEISYTGEYWDFIFTNLVINSMSREADGEIKLTQELSPSTIRLVPKTV